MGTSPALPHLLHGREEDRVPPPDHSLPCSVRTVPRSTPAQTAGRNRIETLRCVPVAWTLWASAGHAWGQRCADDDVTGDGLTDGSRWFLTRRREAASIAVPLDAPWGTVHRGRAGSPAGAWFSSRCAALRTPRTSTSGTRRAGTASRRRLARLGRRSRPLLWLGRTAASRPPARRR